MAPSILAVRRVEPHWQPDLGVRVVDVEPRWHDAQYRRLSTLDVDLPADDRRVPGERALPQLVREDCHRLGVRDVLLLGEDTAAIGGNAERLEQRRRSGHGVHAFGRIALAQVDRVRPIRANLGVRPRPLAQLEVLRRRDPELVEPEAGELARDHHELAGLRVGERFEDDAVDDAEDRAIGADAQRERQDGEECEARRSRQASHGVA